MISCELKRIKLVTVHTGPSVIIYPKYTVLWRGRDKSWSQTANKTEMNHFKYNDYKVPALFSGRLHTYPPRKCSLSNIVYKQDKYLASLQIFENLFPKYYFF